MEPHAYLPYLRSPRALTIMHILAPPHTSKLLSHFQWTHAALPLPPDYGHSPPTNRLATHVLLSGAHAVRVLHVPACACAPACVVAVLVFLPGFELSYHLHAPMTSLDVYWYTVT